MLKSAKEITHAVIGGHPIILLVSVEEQRVLRILQSVAKQKNGIAISHWTCTRGFRPAKEDNNIHDPVRAVQWVIDNDATGFYVLFDLPDFFSDTSTQRIVRDAYNALMKQQDKTLFLVSANAEIPAGMTQCILPIEVETPPPAELFTLTKQVLAEEAESNLGPDDLGNIAYSLSGLSLDEARFVLQRVRNTESLHASSILDAVQRSKQYVGERNSPLQYIAERPELSGVGGLNYLKEWIEQRKPIFNQQSVNAGLPLPRGILIMGISGCGKSLCAKVVAQTWGVPLFRLDMNLVYANLHGNPEATFHRALKTIESIAPAVLWIDEIENGLGFSDQKDSIQAHIFSAFLTWMQEKPPLVFVAATANRIEYLPAEMIRKGRFDQVFFVDLPDKEERQAMFRIHIDANDGSIDTFDLPSLIRETTGWNAAEIEQAVNAAHIEAVGDNRDFNTDDVVRQCRRIVPLSRTMSEQIQFIRDWAWDRATPASRGKGTELSLEE